jgi:polyisoprenoid-binding protein YceI
LSKIGGVIPSRSSTMHRFPISRAVILSLSGLLATTAALAAPVKYAIDSNHTYPSFEADHFGGLSVFRGKIKSTSGTVMLDKEAATGTLDVVMDMSTIDFGNDKLNDHSKKKEMFDVEKFPKATYSGKLTGFKNGQPTEVDGNLTLHGVTKPVKLKLNSFKCITDMMSKKERCGADASGMINREDFGVSFGKDMGFKMDVKLLVQVEALRE